MSEHLAAIAVAIVTVVGGIIAAVMNSRAESEKSIPDQYKELVEEINQFQAAKAAEQDKKIAALTDRVEALQVIADKYDVAVSHIRNLRERFPAAGLPDVPPRIAEDVHGY